MNNKIANKIKEVSPKALRVQAAKKFDTTYDYVSKIVYGKRDATRGKGKLIKEWLLQQIELCKTSEKN